LFAGPQASAHAHCYSRWLYPYPQHCKAAQNDHRRVELAPRVFTALAGVESSAHDDAREPARALEFTIPRPMPDIPVILPPKPAPSDEDNAPLRDHAFTELKTLLPPK
jgi:hypothetical protein